MTAPYQLPDDLLNQPLGVSWGTLGAPTTLAPTPQENQGGVMGIAWQATGQADTDAGQTLRATLATETLFGPAHRIGILESGNARFLTSQNPVLRVVSAQVSPSRQWGNVTWTPIPLGYASPEEEPYSIYNSTAPGGPHGGGAAIIIDGAYVNWCLGRHGLRVRVNYLAGWPHAALLENCTAAAPTIEVDDVTAWAGAAGWISDGGKTEPVFCATCTAALAPAYSEAQNYYPGQSASLSGANFFCLVGNGPGTANGVSEPTPGASTAFWQANPEPQGPGTLTLVTPTLFAHSSPVLVTTMPPNLRWAVALFAKAQALQRGMATLGIKSGTGGAGGGLEEAIAAAQKEAAIEILNYRREV